MFKVLNSVGRNSFLDYYKILRISCRDRSHYETLELTNQCTDKEIRNSFIKLSKKCHPDSNKSSFNSAENTVKFTEIMEAYRVLSRPDARLAYDFYLKNPAGTGSGTVHEPWRDSANIKTGPYYGIKGLKKMSNWKIVVLCILFCGSGITLQFFAIRKSLTLKRDEMTEKSIKAGEVHASVRAEAEKYGNQKQLERILEKIQ